MKAFIIGLFSCALLASGAAWAHDMPAPAEGPQVAAPACGGNGKFVIVVTADKKLVPRPCPGTKRQPAGVGNPGPWNTLGQIRKWTDAGNPDPCYQWTIGGTSYVFCW